MANRVNLFSKYYFNYFSPRYLIIGELIGSQKGFCYSGVYQTFDVTVNVVAQHTPGFKSKTKKISKYQQTAYVVCFFLIFTLARYRRFPNVVMQFGACIDKQGTLFLVSETTSRGNLADVLYRETVSTSKVLRIARDIAFGLHQLHSNNIVHRNLKMKNVVLKQSWKAKILSDYTSSLSVMSPAEVIITSKFCGTIKYSSPEILKEHFSDCPVHSYPYSSKVDIYAFGVLFWEILTNQKAFKRPKEYLGKAGLARYVLAGNRPPVEHTSKLVLDFFSCCWHESPQQRPSFDHILSIFDRLILHIECPDKIGRKLVKQLWRQDIPLVPVSSVIDAFSKCCSLSNDVLTSKKTNYSSYLSTILNMRAKTQNQVSKKQFCRMIGWFGPIDKHQGSLAFFGRIKDFRCRSFCVLEPDPNFPNLLGRGKFLVSPSPKRVGEFVLSYIHNRTHQLHHEYIYNHDGLLYITFSFEKTKRHRLHGWSEAKSLFRKYIPGIGKPDRWALS